MKQVQRKILIPRQNNIFSNRNNSIRLSSQNSERPGTQNITKSDIDALKQGQEKIVQGQEMIVNEIKKMRISKDNLA